MKHLAGSLAVLCALGAAAPALAASAPLPRAACCRIAAGTQVRLALVQAVGTKTARTGDEVALRLAGALIVGGRVVLRAGTPAVGEVIESSGPGMGGKAAKLVLAARYVKNGRTRLPLEGLQLAASGASRANAANAIGAAGIILGPIGFVGMAVPGGQVQFPAGTVAIAKLAAPVTLVSLGAPTRKDLALARADQAGDVPAADSAIAVAPPPRGAGQVVFFRPKSILGTGQWFNVRENGLALGRLTNGAYFVQTERPGVHTFTASEEPEFKDSLRLQVDAGETYFVEGILTHGVVLGAAGLSPSTQAAFAKASAGLKPAVTVQAQETAPARSDAAAR